MTKAKQLGITEFTYYEYDSYNNIIYYEDLDGYWYKNEYNNGNNLISNMDSDGDWFKKDYDIYDNLIFFEGYNFYTIKFFRYYDKTRFIKEINIDYKTHYINYKRNLVLKNLLNE